MQDQHTEAAGRIDGSIPAAPVPASLYLPDLEIRDRLRVVEYDTTVVVHLAGGLAVHLHTAGQAREFIRAFALALDMLTPRNDRRIVNPSNGHLEQLPDPVDAPDAPVAGALPGPATPASTADAHRAGEQVEASQ